MPNVIITIFAPPAGSFCDYESLSAELSPNRLARALPLVRRLRTFSAFCNLKYKTITCVTSTLLERAELIALLIQSEIILKEKITCHAFQYETDSTN